MSSGLPYDLRLIVGISSDRGKEGRSKDRVERDAEPFVLARPDHPISRKRIDHTAIKVLYRLHNAGHDGFLVGGSVRDLLLGIRPKDFDIATDARPAEVRRLFRNSRIIGRRFRLVHVLFRESVIEVATFRADPDPDEQKGGDGDLLITNDNTFGSPRQDAFRRDFTVNALFYDIADFSVVDYVGGIDDLDEGIIRVIGDPDVRFQEDPVRMMRACEFAGRLDFDIEPVTLEGIVRNRDEIRKASPVRLTEELLQLLRSGAASATMDWMYDTELLGVLLPEVDCLLSGKSEVSEFKSVLPAIDEAVKSGGAFPDNVLIAAMLAPGLIEERFRLESGKGRAASRSALRRQIERGLIDFQKRFVLSNHRSLQVFNTLDLFQQLCEPIPPENALHKVTSKPSFHDALDLFELIVSATGDGSEVLEEWREVALRSRRRSNKKRGAASPASRSGRPRSPRRKR